MGSDDDIWIMECDFTIIIVINMFTAPPLFLSLPGIQLALPQCLNIVKGEYKFIYDLLSLEACSPQRKPLSWPRCHTPINTQYLMLTLARHQDPRFVGFIYRGLTEGFQIGFDHRTAEHRGSWRNLPSAMVNPGVVAARISAEMEAGRLIGPVTQHIAHLVHCSPIGLVPKSHQINKWRLIVDLSSPHAGP